MKTPSVIKLPNMSFTVKVKDLSSYDDMYGVTDRDKQLINIQSRMTPVLEKITLLHELLHALEQNTGIKYIDEQQVEQFAHGLYFVLKNNPELLRYLLE